MSEDDLDRLLGGSDGESGNTIWSAIEPVADGKGPIKKVGCFKIRDNLYLCAGDVLLADYGVHDTLPAFR